MRSLEDIARTTAERHRMLDGAPAIVAMVSGGPDSVAMLRLLAAGAIGETGALSVLHVNHRLRAAASDGDEEFVRTLCTRLGIPCTIVAYDVAAYADAEGLNLEDAGRRVRYRFADEEADARASSVGVVRSSVRIAVAHTADDRIETFLSRLISGAGSGGLSSILPVRDRIIRPLIDARRSDVLEYLTSLGQPAREDATNADTSRERSWVRHRLLPVIEDRNTAFGDVALRTMSVLAEEDALLGEMAEAFARDFTWQEADALVVDRTAMLTLSHPMARRAVRSAILAAFPEASRLEFDHIEAIAAGLGDTGFARDLPFGLRAETEYGTLRISRKDSGRLTMVPGLLHCPGDVELGEGGRMQVVEGSRAGIAEGSDRVTLDADSVTWPLIVDGPRHGDRMRPFGLAGTKKLSDMLVDAKVPVRMRPVTPVVRSGERIVWLAGVRLAEECRVTAETARAVDIVWHRPNAGTDASTD